MYQVLYTFSNVDDLRLVRGGGPTTLIAATVMGTHWPLDNDFTVYEWDSPSTTAESLPNVVWPTDLDTMAPSTANGRWKKIESLQTAPQVNSDWTASVGVSAILNKPTLFSGSYPDLTNKPSFAAVATSGSYNDLNTKPTIPAAQVNSDWTASSGLTQILNKPSLFSGAYADLTGKPTIPTVNTVTQSTSSRALNSVFQISTTRNALVFYSVQETVTANITGGQNGDVVLEIASDSGMTTNVQTVSIGGLGQTYTLAVALQGVQPQTGVVAGLVPAGYYARLRTVNNTGTPTFSIRAQQEVLL